VHLYRDTVRRGSRELWRRSVDLGFRLLYHELAWTYDWVAWLVSLGHWKNWGQLALPYVRGPRVLELGHGPGHILTALAHKGFQVIGLDLSPQMGRLARKRLKAEGSPANLVRGRAQSLPFPTSAFDSVVATFPTRYILDPATVQDIARVVKPDGRLVVVMTAQLTRQDPLSRFIRWLFTITGQSMTNHRRAWHHALIDASFKVEQCHIALDASTVWLLIGTPGQTAIQGGTAARDCG
jgi:ubiquinone/menaquinone biosynthesis C-methylase UbiE